MKKPQLLFIFVSIIFSLSLFGQTNNEKKYLKMHATPQIQEATLEEIFKHFGISSSLGNLHETRLKVKQIVRSPMIAVNKKFANPLALFPGKVSTTYYDINDRGQKYCKEKVNMDNLKGIKLTLSPEFFVRHCNLTSFPTHSTYTFVSKQEIPGNEEVYVDGVELSVIKNKDRAPSYSIMLIVKPKIQYTTFKSYLPWTQEYSLKELSHIDLIRLGINVVQL